jgi:hypothetical protein
VQLKRKAPYGESGIADSLKLVMTNHGLNGGVALHWEPHCLENQQGHTSQRLNASKLNLRHPCQMLASINLLFDDTGYNRIFCFFQIPPHLYLSVC